MQSFYISGSNVFSIRTKSTGSSDLTLYLQDMFLNTNQSSSLTYDWDGDEQLLQFTASIQNASVGNEYRAWIEDGCNNRLWNGSVQVYGSQSIDKPVYTNQLPIEDGYVSNVTTNEYIILD